MRNGVSITRSALRILACGLPGDGVDPIEDDRGVRTRRWSMLAFTTGLPVGMTGRLQGIRRFETMSAGLSRDLPRKLGIRFRLPETTTPGSQFHGRVRSLLEAVYRQVRPDLCSEQLDAGGVPRKIDAFDGTATRTPYDRKLYPLEQPTRGHTRRQMAGTPVSWRAPISVHASPIPMETNRMGHSATTLCEVAPPNGCGSLVETLTTTTGMTWVAKATVLGEEVAADSLFAANGTQLPLLDQAEQLLVNLPRDDTLAITEKTVGGKHERSRPWRTTGNSRHHERSHTRTIPLVRSETVPRDGTRGIGIDHCALENEDARHFTTAHRLAMLCARWHLEDGNPKALDALTNRLWGDETVRELALQENWPSGPAFVVLCWRRRRFGASPAVPWRSPGSESIRCAGIALHGACSWTGCVTPSPRRESITSRFCAGMSDWAPSDGSESDKGRPLRAFGLRRDQGEPTQYGAEARIACPSEYEAERRCLKAMRVSVSLTKPRSGIGRAPPGNRGGDRQVRNMAASMNGHYLMRNRPIPAAFVRTNPIRAGVGSNALFGQCLVIPRSLARATGPALAVQQRNDGVSWAYSDTGTMFDRPTALDLGSAKHTGVTKRSDPVGVKGSKGSAARVNISASPCQT